MELNDEIRAQKNSELRQRIYRALQSMYKLFRGSPTNIQIIDGYMNIWKPLSNDICDVVLFPYESKKGLMAEKKNATHCLLALITTTIKLWHKHRGEGGDDHIEALEANLDKIELIVKGDLQFPVRGSDVTGYYLKVLREEKG